MYVSRDMVDVALMSARIEQVAEPSPDTTTVARQEVRDDISFFRQQATDSGKVSFDTELSRHRTTLKLDHSHCIYLFTTQSHEFPRDQVSWGELPAGLPLGVVV